jgi:formylglycine-generating enzyme required for sulfatase activity
MDHLKRSVAILTSLAVFFIPGSGSAEETPVVPQESKEKKFWTEPTTGMKFVWIEEGCFQMGQLPTETRYLKRDIGEDDYEKYYEDELPRHKVCVDGFWMGVHEVNQREWKKIMGFNPAHFNENEENPVDKVSWEDAKSFAEILNKKNNTSEFRLPTEAEWEYGARGGTVETMYHTGDTITPEQATFNGTIPFALNLRQDYRKSPTPVGSFPPNEFGLHDMHGNVWEWCNDWYNINYYKNSPGKNPPGPKEGEMRVLRGGSWFRYAGQIRAATRYKNRPVGQFADTGFRLVKSKQLTSTGYGEIISFDPDF